ncbi:MAG: DUF4405 domain-containing protein [Phycisphaerales bacterium]
MDKARFNLLIDLLAGALLTAIVATGVVLWFILPPGTNRTHQLWGLLRHEWGSVHALLTLVLLVVLAVHVVLHGRWLSIGVGRRLGLGDQAARAPRRFGLVLAVIAAAPLVVVVIAAAASVRPLPQPLHPLASHTAAQSPDALGINATLTIRCASCHGPSDPAAGFRADTAEALLVHGLAGWIEPAFPEHSRLFALLKPSQPGSLPMKHRIPEADRHALEAWVRSLPTRRDGPPY